MPEGIEGAPVDIAPSEAPEAAPETGAPATEAPAEAAPASTDSGPSLTFEVDGEQHTVSAADAPQHFLRQADYTRKTQDLARERETLQEAEALRVALEADPATTLQVLTDAYGLSPQQAQQVVDENQQTYEDPEEQRWQRVEGFMASTEEAQARAEVDAEFAALEQEVGVQNVDRNELIGYAIQNQIPNLKLAWRDIQWNKALEQRNVQRSEEDAKALAAKQGASFVEGGHSPAAGAVEVGGAQEIKTPRDAWRAAKRQLGY